VHISSAVLAPIFPTWGKGCALGGRHLQPMSTDSVALALAGRESNGRLLGLPIPSVPAADPDGDDLRQYGRDVRSQVHDRGPLKVYAGLRTHSLYGAERSRRPPFTDIAGKTFFGLGCAAFNKHEYQQLRPFGVGRPWQQGLTDHVGPVRKYARHG